MKMKELDEAIEALDGLNADSLPKNVRLKIEAIIGLLKESTELSIRVHKALNELDEIANDVNLQSYTRTQIWNVVSLLEKL